jgi:hypothetical protein
LNKASTSTIGISAIPLTVGGGDRVVNSGLRQREIEKQKQAKEEAEKERERLRKVAKELESQLEAAEEDAERWRKTAEEIPDAFECSITQDMMTDPVICSDGHTYERSAIVDWFTRGNNTSPKTGAQLLHQNLIPNISLRQAIEEFKESQRQFRAHK